MKIDLAKRKAVMERSIRLGHCICEPRRACPCDVFTDHGICPCAGERPDPAEPGSIKLTAMARNQGCASKIAPGDLERFLKSLPEVEDENVISGLAAADDAAIYRISDSLCIVQTVDVFTPCVDDARLFGRICAANCLSDIYATGGTPKTALSILCFPSETLPGELMAEMLEGAMETMSEAGVSLIGGHSIKDEEVKLGFAVTGLIDPALAASLSSPKPGDLLVLTKPLGTGVLNFAAQVGRARADGMREASESMTALNQGAAEIMIRSGASGCTDITGFGLYGHLCRMLQNDALSAELWVESFPSFPGVSDLLHQDVIPGAVERNREYVANHLAMDPDVDPSLALLGFDAQTSGGLLIAISPEKLEIIENGFRDAGKRVFLIGRLTDPAGARIVLRSRQGDATVSTNPASGAPIHTDSKDHSEACCADIFNSASPSDVGRAFGAMMQAVQAGGALDERTKELIMFALVLQSRCEPCFDVHYRKAVALGITRAQMDEVAWCAIAMGGAPVKAFYESQRRTIT